MRYTPYQQRGLSSSSIMFLIMIITFSLWIFFKLFPMYLENKKVSQVLEDIKSNPEALQKTSEEIKRLLRDGLSNKNITRITEENFQDQVTITKTERGFEITVKYQQIAPVMGKLSFLNQFEKTVEAP